MKELLAKICKYRTYTVDTMIGARVQSDRTDRWYTSVTPSVHFRKMLTVVLLTWGER